MLDVQPIREGRKTDQRLHTALHIVPLMLLHKGVQGIYVLGLHGTELVSAGFIVQ